MRTIIVPVDGTTNVKLEALDYETLQTVFSLSTPTPVKELRGLDYNCTEAECAWFDRTIRELPADLRDAVVIAPVARGASGGLVGADNTLVEEPGEGVTLAYTQKYPDEVEEAFRDLAGSPEDFFRETGSIRDFPGSLTLIKRFVFEEMVRPGLLNRSACFATYGLLMSGHFLGGDYLRAVRTAGNEHSYWMCHSGARNISEQPGAPSSLSRRIPSFGKLVPAEPYPVYRAIGKMPQEQAHDLGFSGEPLVVPGGHDTCLSHIPIMSTFYHFFPGRAGTPVIHVDAGSWTMVARIGGMVSLPADGYKRDIIIQGTVDGEPVVTARYGGGNDFRHIRNLTEQRGFRFGGDFDEELLRETARLPDCMILPNIHPVNHLTGPFPGLKGRIMNEDALFSKPELVPVVANLTTALTTAVQIDAVSGDRSLPLVITAAGAKDPYFGRLLATVTGRDVYALVDNEGRPLTETTSLGAALVGKAAVLGTHPYRIDMGALGVEYHKLEPFASETKLRISNYHEMFIKAVQDTIAME